MLSLQEQVEHDRHSMFAAVSVASLLPLSEAISVCGLKLLVYAALSY
jgi:hypothetical protein